MTFKQKQYIIEHYAVHGWKPIAKIFDLTRPQIQSFAKRNKIKRLKPTFEYISRFDLFANIQCPEIAYTLGFLWADSHLYVEGNFKALRVNFLKKDYLAIKNILHYGIKWKVTFKPKTKERQPQAILYTSDEKLCNLLFDLDFHKKSLVSPTKILSKIPYYLHNYFWRGYFDGDGCIYLRKNNSTLTLSASLLYDWTDIKLLLDKTLNLYNYAIRQKKSKNGNSSVVEIRNRPDILKFCNYIYSEKLFGLKRKYRKYLLITKKKVHQKTSQYIGVSFNKKRKKWRAFLGRKYLGAFDTEDAAYEARKRFKSLNDKVVD